MYAVEAPIRAAVAGYCCRKGKALWAHFGARAPFWEAVPGYGCPGPPREATMRCHAWAVTVLRVRRLGHLGAAPPGREDDGASVSVSEEVRERASYNSKGSRGTLRGGEGGAPHRGTGAALARCL